MDEVTTHREAYGKKPFDADDESLAPTKKRRDNASRRNWLSKKRKAVYRNPERNGFGRWIFNHKRQFAYEVRNTYDKHRVVLETVIAL